MPVTSSSVIVTLFAVLRVADGFQLTIVYSSQLRFEHKREYICPLPVPEPNSLTYPVAANTTAGTAKTLSMAIRMNIFFSDSMLCLRKWHHHAGKQHEDTTHKRKYSRPDKEYKYEKEREGYIFDLGTNITKACAVWKQ